MKAELQDKLFKKYPKLFRQKDLPMTETCMCWGIECGDGWYWIIDQLCRCIQSYCNNRNESGKRFQVEAIQVKEKYGELRFYISGGDDHIYGMINLAESLSYSTCEHCGSTDNVTQTKGWITSLCPKCKKIYLAGRKES